VSIPLEAPQWHHVLFPASQPALKRNVELVEGWVVTMTGLLDIKVIHHCKKPFSASENSAASPYSPSYTALLESCLSLSGLVNSLPRIPHALLRTLPPSPYAHPTLHCSPPVYPSLPRIIYLLSL
jgi:hypothetical protein